MYQVTHCLFERYKSNRSFSYLFIYKRKDFNKISKIYGKHKLLCTIKSSIKQKQIDVASATVVQIRKGFKQFVLQPQVYFQQHGTPLHWDTIVKDYL